MDKDSLYIIMPAYNEEANIEHTVRQWMPNLSGKAENSRLIIADSGSTDRTHAILTSLQEEFPQLAVLSDTGRQHGPKVIALYRKAVEDGIDYVFQTDSDGQTDPAEFAAFWDRRAEYAGQFGNRTQRGDGAQRAFVEKVVCLLVRLFFGVKVPDANAPFRLMKTEALAKYLPKLPGDFNIPNIMVTVYFSHYGEKIIFPVISFKDRQGGTNSINIPKIVRIGWKAVRDFASLRKDMKKG
ncbi:MAG: glycosyltransferase family 2 protein [Lachnospiraceae bacterium]|nr:glycosyltransferase family 2 protein [Lachnospiraceae bacterium]